MKKQRDFFGIWPRPGSPALFTSFDISSSICPGSVSILWTKFKVLQSWNDNAKVIQNRKWLVAKIDFLQKLSWRKQNKSEVPQGRLFWRNPLNSVSVVLWMSSLDIPSWPNPSGESLQTNHTTWISEIPDPRLVHEVDKVFGIRDILQSLLLSKIATSTHWVAFFFQALVTSHIVSHLLLLEGIQLLSSCLKQNTSKETLDCENPSKWISSHREIESREGKWTNERKVCFTTVTMFETWHIMARFYLQPLSQLPSLPPKSIIHFLFYLLFTWSWKVRSECLVTFILSIRFSILSADSWHFFQIHKLRTHFTSRHLFSSLYIRYSGLFAHRCITQTNLWSSSKSGSGLREMNKWAKLWETNDEMKQQSWTKWWKYKNSKETGTVPTLNSSSNFQTLDTLFPCCKAPISLALLLCHVTICAMTYVHMSLSLTCKLQKKMHGFHWSIRKCNTQNKLIRFARSRMARTLLPAFESMK